MGIGADLKHGIKGVPLWGWGAIGVGGLFLIMHRSKSVQQPSIAPVIVPGSTTTGIPDASGAVAVPAGASVGDISSALNPLFQGLGLELQAGQQQLEADLQTGYQQQQSFMQQSQDYQAQLLAAIAGIGVGAGPGNPPVTQPPVTQPPVTQPPVTQPPVTQPPVTQPPPPIVYPPPTTQPPIYTPPPVSPPPPTSGPSFPGLLPVPGQSGYYTISGQGVGDLTTAIQWNGSGWSGFNASAPLQVVGTAPAGWLPTNAPLSGQIQVGFNQGGVQGSVVLIPNQSGGYYYAPFLGTPQTSIQQPTGGTLNAGTLQPVAPLNAGTLQPVNLSAGVLQPVPNLTSSLGGSYASPYQKLI